MKQNLSTQKPVELSPRGQSHRSGSLRTRLLAAFALLAILPVLVIGSVATLISSQGLRDIAIDELTSVSILKKNEIHDWLQVLQTNLGLVFENQLIEQGVFALLQNDAEQQLDQSQLRSELTRFNEKTRYFVEVFVMDTNGNIVLSTDGSQEGKIQKNQNFFQNGLNGQYVSPPVYEVSLGNYSIVLAEPIKSPAGATIGVLTARVNISKLSEIMQQQTGLGDAGETYLVSSNFAALTTLKNTDFELGKTYVRTQGVTEAIKNKAEGFSTYTDYAGNPTFGAYQWIPELQVALIAEHQEQDALAASNRVLQVSIALILFTSLVALAISFLFTRAITSPIINLVDVANSIAQGNFELRANVIRNDEIGVLAKAFNTMTEQLRELFGVLEQRVAERTQALTSVAEVSTAASTILEIDKLLQQVVDLAKERFNFYHTHIYLLDESGNTLVLASGAGEPGRQMVAEKRSIPLDQERSLVARAARERKGVTVNDVTTEPDFLPNPLLPDTHAELAVPMMVGENVIGVFDVQSEIIGRFTNADIAIQTTLASQVASAVQNARLYTQAEASAQEAKSLVENAPEAIVVIDLTTGTFVDANENAVKLYGLDRDELLKVGPAQMSPPTQPDGRNSTEGVMAKIGEALQGKTPVFDWTHRHEQGHHIPCEVRLVRMPGEKPRVRASITDITERKRLQDLTAMRARQQEAINLITQKIQSATTIEEAMQVAARELGQALGKRSTLVTLDTETLAVNTTRK